MSVAEQTAIEATSPLSRTRLFLVLAGLYLAQAIPAYLMVAAVPPIMREQGVSRTTIGLIAILLIPGVLKFLWAAKIDQIRPIARAHRASWILITQTGTVLALFALAFFEPTDIVAFMTIGMIMSVLVSTQDIATDGYAVRQLAVRDRPLGNAIQGGAVALGVVVGGTMSLVIYHHFGWRPMIWTMCAASLLPLIAALSMREDADPEPADQPRASLKAFWARPEAREALLIALVYRASEGLIKAMEGPYLVDRGVPLDIVGYLSGGAAATAGLIGSGLAAILMLRLGASGVLTLLGLLRTLCFALFAAHALDLVTGWPTLFGAAAFQTLIRYMEIVALYSVFMAVSSKAQPGTDFTILACAQLVIYLIGASLAGVLADLMGYGPLFALAAVLSLVAVIFTRSRLRRQSAAAVLAE
jgi:PAT family beta-lactamase induction signal transducer AmpG